jgi:hypothetical protein
LSVNSIAFIFAIASLRGLSRDRLGADHGGASQS